MPSIFCVPFSNVSCPGCHRCGYSLKIRLKLSLINDNVCIWNHMAYLEWTGLIRKLMAFGYFCVDNICCACKIRMPNNYISIYITKCLKMKFSALCNYWLHLYFCYFSLHMFLFLCDHCGECYYMYFYVCKCICQKIGG